MAKLATKRQVSAGGVAFRSRDGQTEVAIVLVGPNARWQIPKGLVGQGESNETAALREVREEAGVDTDVAGDLGVIEYWYVSTERGERVRYHKNVYFFLLRYLSGDTNDHDFEVNEARWVEIDKAIEMLAFDGEKDVMRKAKEMIGNL
ncbi:MAG: NUDIX domain-containing protein [Chloroflexota bacterium]|nr:MAG: NUDIX domain-containing protein [Chloroflexota bacterium]